MTDLKPLKHANLDWVAGTALPAASIPLIVKLAFTAFMAVLVPVYWSQYGPANFLYFCDLALFVTLAAIWLLRKFFPATPALPQS